MDRWWLGLPVQCWCWRHGHGSGWSCDSWKGAEPLGSGDAAVAKRMQKEPVEIWKILKWNEHIEIQWNIMKYIYIIDMVSVKYIEIPCKHNSYWCNIQIPLRNIWESSPLPWLGQSFVCHKAPEGAQGNKRSLGDGPLWKFNFSTVKTTYPLTISNQLQTWKNHEPLHPTLWPPRKREETPPPAPASQTRERLIQDMALTWQGGREFRKLNGWMVKDLADFCTRIHQRTCVHLQMHWARSMPLIKRQFDLGFPDLPQVFRLKVAHSTYCRHGFACFCVTQDVFKHFDKNGDQLLSAPEMLSFVTCRCGSIGGFWASGDHDKMLRLWNNYGSGKPSHRLSAIISHLPGMTETWKAVPGELCGIWR